MIHPNFVLPKVPPAPSPLGVLPDQYIPDLAFDSDSTESMLAIFPPNEPIANNDDIIDLDHLLSSDNSDSDVNSIHLLDLD